MGDPYYLGFYKNPLNMIQRPQRKNRYIRQIKGLIKDLKLYAAKESITKETTQTTCGILGKALCWLVFCQLDKKLDILGTGRDS